MRFKEVQFTSMICSLITALTKRSSLNLFLCVIILVGFTVGCKKEAEDDKGVSASLRIVKGDNQSGIYGELLSDSIILQISSSDTSKQFRVSYELLQGNGAVAQTDLFPGNMLSGQDRQGMVRLKWRLGCDNTVQKIKFSVYPIEPGSWPGQIPVGAKPLDTVIVNASGQPPTGWGRACGCELYDLFRLKIFSYNNERLYMVNSGLYYSDDKGINWYKLTGVPNWNDIVDAQFNSKGWLYVLTKTHGIYYSQDLISWTSINNGILDYRDPTAFLVEDSMLFVSFYFDGPYKTENNGAFWRKLVVGGDSQRFYFIRRHPNGNIYLFNNWDDLMVSENYGANWRKVGLGYQYVPYEAYSFEIDKNGTLYIGAGDATISSYSPQTNMGERHSYYEWNGTSQSVNNIQLYNNDVYYLVNAAPKQGIYSKNNNWGRIDLGFTKPIRYFYIKNDGQFLLASDALYYKR